jgi:hypothetical protein
LQPVAFSAKQLLEVAVMLLGASVSFAAIAASGPLLIGLIVAVVVVMIALSFIISRALSLPVRMGGAGLPHRMRQRSSGPLNSSYAVATFRRYSSRKQAIWKGRFVGFPLTSYV